MTSMAAVDEPDFSVRGRVVRALRDGLGVEDMEAAGIERASIARAVVAQLRAEGRLKSLLRQWHQQERDRNGRRG